MAWESRGVMKTGPSSELSRSIRVSIYEYEYEYGCMSMSMSMSMCMSMSMSERTITRKCEYK